MKIIGMVVRYFYEFSLTVFRRGYRGRVSAIERYEFIDTAVVNTSVGGRKLHCG